MLNRARMLGGAAPGRHPLTGAPLVAALLAGIVSVAACAPSGGGAAVENTGPVDAQRLYQRQCAVCHGATGRGDGPSSGINRAANLTTAEFHARSTAESIEHVIRNGQGLMPPWSYLSDAEIDGLVVFVQSLAPAPPVEGSAEQADSPAPAAE